LIAFTGKLIRYAYKTTKKFQFHNTRANNTKIETVVKYKTLRPVEILFLANNIKDVTRKTAAIAKRMQLTQICGEIIDAWTKGTTAPALKNSMILLSESSVPQISNPLLK